MENRKLARITQTLALIGFLASSIGCAKARYSYNLGDVGLGTLETGTGGDGTNGGNTGGNTGGGSGGGTGGGTGGGAQKTCANTTPTVMAAPLNFPTPSQRCDWNAGGNLGFRDLHFQARREQVVTVTIPANAIVCDMDFEFPSQALYYDDEFLFTFNNKVLASSYTFEPLFTKTGNMLNYDWTRMVGRPWTAVSPDPYCVGEAQGMATCSFPATSQNGTIQLDYQPSIIQEAFSQSPVTGTHEFRWITTGDNDDAVDCLHSPINATVRISYIQ